MTSSTCTRSRCFFRELAELEDSNVREVMQRWGVYYRSRPLAEQENE